MSSPKDLWDLETWKTPGCSVLSIVGWTTKDPRVSNLLDPIGQDV